MNNYIEPIDRIGISAALDRAKFQLLSGMPDAEYDYQIKLVRDYSQQLLVAIDSEYSSDDVKAGAA